MENITGTWALVKTEAVDENGRPTPVAPFGGESFIGRVVFTKEGRMSAAITDARAKIPDGESREYSCYAGAYTFENDTGPDDANHASNGMFILYDPRLPDSNREVKGRQLMDVAPTLLDLMDVPVPHDMQGKRLFDETV